MQQAATAGSDQQKPGADVFGGNHSAYVFDQGRYIELHGASQSELDRFKRAHPTAQCLTLHS